MCRLLYDFYLFTLVMLCYVILYVLRLLKYIWPRESYPNMLGRIVDFIARNFTGQRKSYSGRGGQKENA